MSAQQRDCGEIGNRYGWLAEGQQGASPSIKSSGPLPNKAPPPSAPHSSPQDPVAPADGLSSLQVCVPWEEDITFPVVGEEAGDLRDWGLLAGTDKACLGHLERYRVGSFKAC